MTTKEACLACESFFFPIIITSGKIDFNNGRKLVALISSSYIK